jgi:hypothetical protein
MSFDPPLLAPLSEYLAGPDLAPDSARDRSFGNMARALIGGQGCQPIDFDLRYPKHEFLRFVAEGGHALLHGSNDPAIDVMSTSRRSVDARLTHSGNAVFACADGLWAIYYALIDRTEYQGTLRNDARLLPQPDGTRRRAYFLSVNATARWRSGVVYLLPTDTFTRFGDESSLEWASAIDVRPFASLAVSPNDFPLLDAVRVHDDSPLVRLRELSLKLVRTHTGFDELDDGYLIRYARDDVWASEAEELIALLQSVNTWLKGDVDLSDASEMRVRLYGSPALKDMLGRGLAAPR